MNWPDCTEDDDIYAKLKEELASAMGEELYYPMSLVGDDYHAVATAWNQGIDSHLEALTERSTVQNKFNGIFQPRAEVRIHREELPTLVRRLYEDPPHGADLAGGILTSLNIEVS